MAQLLGYVAGDTIAAAEDAPVGAHTLLISDGRAEPPAGAWSLELLMRASGRVVTVWRSTRRTRAGDSIQIAGAEHLAAVAIDPTEGANVQIDGEGGRRFALADWKRDQK